MMKKLLCTLLIAIVAVGTINAQGTISGGSPLDEIDTSPTSTTINTPVTAEGTDFGIVSFGGGTQQNTFTFVSTFAGTQNLTIQGISGADATEFTASFAPGPSSVTGIGTPSSFIVNFSPQSSGPKTAILELKSNTTPFAPAISYFFEIVGIGGSPAPIIKVTGEDSLEITNASTTSPGDNTDFGSVTANVANKSKQYTIENEGNSDLLINNIFNSGNPDFSVSLGGISFPYTISAGNSVSFNVIFTPTTPASSPPDSAVINSFIAIAAIDPANPPVDPIDSPYNFFFGVQGEGVVAVPDMEVFGGVGNNVLIVDGDGSPSLNDFTQFVNTDINTFGGSTRTFTIRNNGTAPLNLTSQNPIVNIGGVNAGDFSVTTQPTTPIAPGDFANFTVTFSPTDDGPKTAEIIINNNSTATGKSPYNFAIAGLATDAITTGQLLITQYYEGIGANDQWVEVKNVSSQPTTNGVYSLNLYQDANTVESSIIANSPQYSELIPALAPGEVHVFYNSVGGMPLVPLSGNRGSASNTGTNACRFDGNDVILISTSSGVNTYNDRVDIMGVVPTSGTPPFWGSNKSFIKGCGTSMLPTREFDIATGASGGLLVEDYLQLNLEEVDNAGSLMNIALGTQNLGITTWTSSWDNGDPDKTRVAVVSGTYNASNGSIAACDLTVTGTVDMNGGTTNYVEVNRNFINTGSVTIGNQESLFTVSSLDPTNIGGPIVNVSGSITKLETTTNLTNEDDYTYWSSPVSGEVMSSVFSSTTYNQSRMYYWDQAAVNVDNLGGSEALGEWIPAAGETMRPGKGYISQGPVGIANNTATVSFSGTPNTGNVILTKANNDIIFNDNGNSNDDLALIGNPYPSAIDADKFIALAANDLSIDGTLSFWTHSTPNNGSSGEQYVFSDYAQYNMSGGTASVNGGPTPNKYIASGQGFMVNTISNSSSIQVVFDDDMRVRQNNTQFFRDSNNKKSTTATDEEDRVWLNLESNKGGAFSQILVGFFEDATDAVDYGYDGTKISENWVNLYSKIDTVKYGIQGLSSFNAEKKVALALNSYIEDADITYNISIDRFEGALRDSDIYLVDNELNVIHDLKQGAYNFNLPSSGNYEDRFTLQFTKATLDVDDFETKNNLLVINEDNAFLVKSKTIVKEMKVYDMTGRLLVNMLPNESEFRINTSSIRKGTVLILNTIFENGTQISKKAIKF